MTVQRATKDTQIGLVRDGFSKATSAVLLDFKGIDVETVTALRVKFRAAGVHYRVAKNKVITKAIEGTALGENAAFKKYLTGPSGIAWSFEDPSAAAKVIAAFRKEGDKQGKLGIKCAVLDNSVMDGARVESDLATMPGKDELRAMLLATFQAPAQSLVRQLAAAGQNLAYVLDARQRSLGEGK